MTEPKVHAVWIDPLTLFDAYLKLVSNREQPYMALLAKVNDHILLAKGADRAAWLQDFQEDPDDPVVTFVPHYNMSLFYTWQPLNFSRLPEWLKQFDTDANIYHPCADDNVRKLHAFARRVTNTEARTQEFTVMVKLHLHPNSRPYETGVIPADKLAQLFVVERSNTSQYFPPMMTINLQGLGTAHGHVHSTDHPEIYRRSRRRQGWRKVMQHGTHPDVSFYGKQWIANRSQAHTLYAGIELEMELESRQSTNALAALFCVADEFGLGDLETQNSERLHFETDGSVRGLEAPLMPHEIGSAHAEMFWRKIWQAACQSGASNNNMSCGTHIHVNADGALNNPPTLAAQLTSMGVQYRESYFRETTGLLIDLITNMLAGGPHRWRFAPNNYNTPIAFRDIRHDAGNELPDPLNIAFGRPKNWTSNYAVQAFAPFRRDAKLSIDRYSAVNWSNENTIEFRLFGPNNFKQETKADKDWLNVITQTMAAIVEFSRMHALRLTLKGAELRNQPFAMFRDALPKWLVPMLVCEDYNQSWGMVDHNDTSYAVCKPNFAVGEQIWLPGTLRPAWRDESTTLRARYETRNTRTDMSSSRRTKVFAACSLVWHRFLEFVHNESPRFDIAAAHLEQIEALLPTRAWIDERLGIETALPPVRTAPSPFTRGEQGYTITSNMIPDWRTDAFTDESEPQ